MKLLHRLACARIKDRGRRRKKKNRNEKSRFRMKKIRKNWKGVK